MADLLDLLPAGLRSLVAAVWSKDDEPVSTRLRAALGLLKTALAASPDAKGGDGIAVPTSKDANRAAALADLAAKTAEGGDMVRSAELFTAALRLAPEPYAAGNSLAARLWAGRAAVLRQLTGSNATERALSDSRRAALCSMPRVVPHSPNLGHRLPTISDSSGAPVLSSGRRTAAETTAAQAAADSVDENMDRMPDTAPCNSVPAACEAAAANVPALVFGGPDRLAMVTGLWRIAGQPVSTTQDRRGRFVVASTHIAAGTVIMADPAVAWTVQPAAAATHCHYCLQPTLPAAAVPCSGCAIKSYCSGRCRRADALVHKVTECGKPFSKNGPPPTVKLAHRLATSLASGRFSQQLKHDVAALLTHQEQRTMEANCSGSTAEDLAWCAALADGDESTRNMAHSTMPSSVTSAELVEQLWRIQVNGVGISTVLAAGHLLGGATGALEAVQQQRIGLGCFPNVALLNHSCRPNAVLRFKLCAPAPAPPAPPVAELVAIAGIAEGEEVTISYGPVAGWMDASARMQALQEQYFFRCHCAECAGEEQTATERKFRGERKSKVVAAALQRLQAEIAAAERLTNAAAAGLASGKPPEGAIGPLQQAVANLADPLLLPPNADWTVSAGLWRAAGAAHDCLARAFCSLQPKPNFEAAARHCGASVALLERAVFNGRIVGVR
eukprot:SAG31_NODE_717_length_12611_cov_25.933104_4_plen_672_part_00